MKNTAGRNGVACEGQPGRRAPLLSTESKEVYMIQGVRINLLQQLVVSQFVPSSSFPRRRESTPNIAVAFRTRADKGVVRSMDPRLRGDDGGEQYHKNSN